MYMCTCVCLCTYTELSFLLRGLLKVAEVSSRFKDVRTFLGAVTKLGFKVISKVRSPRSWSLFCFTCGPFLDNGVQEEGHRYRHRYLPLEGTIHEKSPGKLSDQGWGIDRSVLRSRVRIWSSLGFFLLVVFVLFCFCPRT